MQLEREIDYKQFLNSHSPKCNDFRTKFFLSNFDEWSVAMRPIGTHVQYLSTQRVCRCSSSAFYILLMQHCLKTNKWRSQTKKWHNFLGIITFNTRCIIPDIANRKSGIEFICAFVDVVMWPRRGLDQNVPIGSAFSILMGACDQLYLHSGSTKKWCFHD